MINKEKQASLEQKVFEAYIQKTIKSNQLYERACKIITNGVTSSGRSFIPYPLYMTHGKGSKTYDVDKNEYIDCFLCAGPLLLGHNHPEVMEYVKKEINRGLLLFSPDLVFECAEILKEIIPCAEMIRFQNTGTEVTISAVRLARAYTGKKKIIKFYGHYHGGGDQFLIGTSNNKEEPVSLGIPKEYLKNTILLKYNDIDNIKQKLDEDNDIAGIILEPQMNYGGLFPPSSEFLKKLRKLTRERGIVLIFDEVVTGFRLALGGAQEYFNVTPDLAVFAKSISAGAKLAAIAGKKKIMNTMSINMMNIDPPAKKEINTFVGGTMNDGTIALAAAIATLKIYKKLNKAGEYRKLHERSKYLSTSIEDAFRQRGMPCYVNNLGPSLKLWLTQEKPNFDEHCNLDKSILRLFFLSLINEGIFLSAPSNGSIFLSFVHSDIDIQKVIDAVHFSLDKYKFEEIFKI